MNYPNWAYEGEVERWVAQSVDDPVRQAVMLAAYRAGRENFSRVLQRRFGSQVASWIESNLGDEPLDALVVAGAWAGMCEAVLP